MENLLKLGLLLMVIGFILIFASALNSKNLNLKAAGGIFIGPFPVFGAFTDKNSYYLLIAIAVIIFLISFFLNR